MYLGDSSPRSWEAGAQTENGGVRGVVSDKPCLSQAVYGSLVPDKIYMFLGSRTIAQGWRGSALQETESWCPSHDVQLHELRSQSCGLQTRAMHAQPRRLHSPSRRLRPMQCRVTLHARCTCRESSATAVCDKKHLLGEPLPCNPSAEAVIQPLMWYSKTLCVYS